MKVISKSMEKVFNSTVKILNEDKMILDHCISDDQPDRVGDIMDIKGWELSNYKRNPVVLDGHDYNKPPIGKNLKLYTTADGQLRAETQFAPTDEGKKYFELYKSGFMSAFSVGFIPKEYEPSKAGGYLMTKSELLEYSVVTVPCNPRALKSFLKEREGEIMNEEQIKELIATAVSEKQTEISKSFEAKIEEKDATIKTLQEEVATLKAVDENSVAKKLEEAEAKVLSLTSELKEATEKSGAAVSKATLGILKGICEGHDTHTKALRNFIQENTKDDNDGDEGTGKEPKLEEAKEYSEEDIKKLVDATIENVMKGVK